MAKAKGKKKTEVLDYGAQVRSLREQGPGRLYLLWGREDYLREQYLLELKKLCLPGGDVRPVCKALNEAFGGRGGGKPGFCQGSLACTDFADVQNFLVNYHE